LRQARPPDAGRSLTESGRYSDEEVNDAIEQVLAELDGHIQPRR
jgi:hypothetical protein